MILRFTKFSVINLGMEFCFIVFVGFVVFKLSLIFSYGCMRVIRTINENNLG